MKFNAFILFAICCLYQIVLGSLYDGKISLYVVDDQQVSPRNIMFKEQVATGSGVFEVLQPNILGRRLIDKTETHSSMRAENEKLKAELVEQSKELRHLKKSRMNTDRNHPMKSRIKKNLQRKYIILLKKLRVGVMEQLRLINEEISELETSDKSPEFI